MEVPKLGVEMELQLPAYATATATPDPSCVCNLHHSSPQCWILNPWSKARDRTCNLMLPSQIRFSCSTTETSVILDLLYVAEPNLTGERNTEDFNVLKNNWNSTEGEGKRKAIHEITPRESKAQSQNIE